MNNYLNPITVSLHLLAYAFFCISAFKLHKDLHKLKGSYSIGPIEAVMFMCVPFFYIFWNAYWVEKACRSVTASAADARMPRLFGLHLQAWLIVVASPFIFPDNMDKVSPLASIAFIVTALLISEGLRKRLRGHKDADTPVATVEC